MKLIFRWFIVLFALVQSVIADPLKDRNRPVAETDALSPEQTVASFSLPDGFSANVFAAEPDIVQPIGFATDDRGRTWVLENTNYPVCPGEKAILNASASNGRKLFSQRCAACHILHGEGA
ncbi:MAG: hypothetical protein OSA84_12015, partial [Akkermansiaceae bacterium]|nr:hypothetical protein [Akkermansiaceae bacterium]